MSINILTADSSNNKPVYHLRETPKSGYRTHTPGMYSILEARKEIEDHGFPINRLDARRTWHYVKLARKYPDDSPGQIYARVIEIAPFSNGTIKVIDSPAPSSGITIDNSVAVDSGIPQPALTILNP